MKKSRKLPRKENKLDKEKRINKIQRIKQTDLTSK